ncbi:MAG TPA: hypothetical protein PLD59_11295, partial [Tepidisphaeraceae bacterium]|nr:hypothetical protein [Tepidisphaeraceae bacterium]
MIKPPGGTVAKCRSIIILRLTLLALVGGCGPDITRPIEPSADRSSAGRDSSLRPNQASPNQASPAHSPSAQSVPNQPSGPIDRTTDGPRVRAVNLNTPTAPVTQQSQIQLAVAKNETASFAIQISTIPKSTNRRALTLRLTQLANAGNNIPADNLVVYQILSMPIDVNRAGFVRHTGMPGDQTTLPRALLPLSNDNGRINLATLRDPQQPTNPAARAEGTGQPVLVWFDLKIPPQTPPGTYRASVEVIDSGSTSALSSVPVSVTVHDFVLPDERHLLMAGQVEWEDLLRLFPDRFEAVRANRLDRNDPDFKRPIETLDRLVSLAQQHRMTLTFSRLQPIVKWPAGKPPEIVWDAYDRLVSPWLKGDIFPDKVPLGFWPLPIIDYFYTYLPESRGEYLSQAAAHFDQMDWMTRSAAPIGPEVTGRASTDQSLSFSVDAQQLLSLHPRMRVRLPLQEDQLQLSRGGREMMIAPENVQRVIAAAPQLVFSSPVQRLPTEVKRPALWLKADLTDAASSGVTPYVGAGGDEYDVRLWAWLSFLRNATLIQWPGVLPRANQPSEPADPNELVWFYPGSWFGVDDPIPTVQLKWLRNAQQDYEYLWLARQRGQTINAYLVARLITKPVEIQPNQEQDPTYALMCGTANPGAWREARQLIADNILLRDPGVPLDSKRETEINMRMLRWSTPQERPVLTGRVTQWTRDTQAGLGQNWVNLRLGIDIYNASDSRPDQNTLQWTAAYPGSEFSPKPISIPALATYNVRRFTVEARIDPTAAPAKSQTPVELTFINGFTNESTPIKLQLPVAVSDRRQRPININGDLDDWTGEDALTEDRPLVQMFNRPALQAGVIEPASTPSGVYSSWSDERFYVAFKVAGLPNASERKVRNFVNYQFRRAWGEDLCQLLIQPVYADNTPGPVLHVVCKSNGSLWIERKIDPKLAINPWQAFEGAGIRYQARIDGTEWRGEVAIPWNAIMDASKQIGPDGRPRLPSMLRFNFSQHKSTTGESSSWAGPIDFGRDDAFTGIILLR